VELYRQAAKDGDKTLEEYIQKFSSSSDADFQHEGAVIQAIVVRSEFLQKATLSLKESSLIFRPVIFVRYADEKVAQDAWKSFAPGFSFTAEGVLWGVVGAIFGSIFFASCRGLFSRKTKKNTDESK
jgi:hypothetical protein